MPSEKIRGLDEHTVKAFDEQLRHLSNLVLQMGGLAEAQVAAAIDAVARRDEALAARTVEGDIKIDHLEAAVNDAVLKILALRQPMATDLRLILAALRISADLERIADYGKNIAKRAIALSQSPRVQAVGALSRMARMVQRMIKDVLDAYVALDADKALAVWHADQEVDEAYNSLFRELLTYMMEDPRDITSCAHMLFMAKNVERIGDLATNIAETIYFVVHGRPLEEERPKGDRTSYGEVDAEAPTDTSEGEQR